MKFQKSAFQLLGCAEQWLSNSFLKLFLVNGLFPVARKAFKPVQKALVLFLLQASIEAKYHLRHHIFPFELLNLSEAPNSKLANSETKSKAEESFPRTFCHCFAMFCHKNEPQHYFYNKRHLRLVFWTTGMIFDQLL